jgi:hypothetical protein
LSSQSALTSPSYIGNLNFTSSLNKGISFLCLWTCFFVLDLELELEEEREEGGEGGI